MDKLFDFWNRFMIVNYAYQPSSNISAQFFPLAYLSGRNRCKIQAPLNRQFFYFLSRRLGRSRSKVTAGRLCRLSSHRSLQASASEPLRFLLKKEKVLQCRAKVRPTVGRPLGSIQQVRRARLKFELPMVVVVAVESLRLPRHLKPEQLQAVVSNCSTKQCSDGLFAYHLITNRPHTQLRFTSLNDVHAHR